MLEQSRVDKILERIRPIPIVETLKMRFDQFDVGFCKMTVPYDHRYDGIYESFHGGTLMTVADSVACFAIMTQTGPDEVLTTASSEEKDDYVLDLITRPEGYSPAELAEARRATGR